MDKYSDECIALAEIIHTLSWKKKCGLIEVLSSLQDTANSAEPPVSYQEKV